MAAFVARVARVVLTGYFPAMSEGFNRPKPVPAPLVLLLRVNALQGWRRFLSVRGQSRLLTSVTALFIGGYLFVSFALFYHGLKFIAKFPGLGAVLTERLIYVLFAFLFALLLLSNLVIGYTNLFRNRETAFLLTLPVPAQTIFRWKFIESTVLASWAFVFLIAPLLAAFGLVRGVPWHFYPVTLMLIALFIVLPGVLGAALATGVGRFLDRRSFQIALIGTAIVLLALAAFWWKAQPVNDELLDKRTLEALDQLLAKTRFTLFPFLPSYWLSASVLQWAEGILRGAAFFALVLLSHTLFFGGILCHAVWPLVLWHGLGGAKPRGRRMELVSWPAGPPVSRRPARKNRRAIVLAPARHPRAGGQRPADVLAGHHAMGAVGDAVRPAGRLCHQPAQLHPPVDQPVLGQPGRLSESRRLLAESRFGDDAVCVPAIFARRPAAVDHRPGADGPGVGWSKPSSGWPASCRCSSPPGSSRCPVICSR